MKELFKKYLWIFEFIGAAIIVAVGLVCALKQSILYFIVGMVFVIMGAYRIIPLLKTTDDKLLKWIYLVEIVISVAAGALLIVLALKENETDLKSLFGYIIGGILYLRGLVFFFSTSIRKETSELLPFIVHVTIFTVGTVIIAHGGFEVKTLGWVIFALAMLTSLVISFAGYKSYRNFRGNVATKRLTKKVEVEESVSKDAPTSEEISDTIEDKDIKEEDLPVEQA